MTTIDLDELSPPRGITQRPGDFSRDSKGAPYVFDPDGELVKSSERKGLPKLHRYGRPSSLGKDIENTYNLQRWRERQIVIGMAKAFIDTDAAEFVELQQSMVALAEFDPSSDEAKEEADGLIALCKRFAKADLAARQGTHMHEVTEDDDLERDPIARMERDEEHELPIEVQQAMLEAWRAGVEQYGLVMLEVESHVVHDEWRQAGTLDRLALLTRDIRFANGVVLPAGTVILLDVKTGKLTLTAGGLVQYWHSYAVQCAIYAASKPYDVDTGERGEWPQPIDQRWAVIAHLPVKEALEGKATLRLVLCDIAAGREAIETIVTPMKAWNARHDLFHFTADEEPKIEVDIEGLTHIGQCADEAMYRMWLTCRLAQISDHEGARGRMVALWPAGVPGIKSDHAHTQDELEQIEGVITRVEADFQLPFAPDPRPAPPVPEPPTAPPAPWSAPDEGEILGMDHEDIAAVRKRIGKISVLEQQTAEQWMKEAVAVNRGFSIKQCPSRRRWLIYRLTLELATLFEGDADVARATLALVMPEAEQLGVTIGCALGSLTMDEARRLLDVLPDLAREGALIFDGNTPRWSAAPAA